MSERVIVTAAPPTPNGDLHLGHLSGPYSGADILARACRLIGREAVYLVGSDIHQSYVPEKARQHGADPMAMAKSFDDEIGRLFATLELSNAGFVRPEESALHAEMVTAFVRDLRDAGKLETRTEDCLHCPSCDRYLFSAYVTGECPFCGNDDCDAGVCEKCARPNSGADLIAPHCNVCGGAAELRPYTRLVFPLSQYASRLREHHRSTVLGPQMEALTEDLLARGLPDVAISHVSDWGIPAPGFQGQCIDVWAEMVPGYFAALASALDDPREWRAVWDSSTVVQFYGWDNGWFHTLLFPALMMAHDPGLRLPAAHHVNEFLLLGDSKFSTSREHAIWGNDLLAVAPADVVRFALAHDRPQFEQTSFSLDRLHGLVDLVLVGRWQRWLSGVFDGIDSVPSGAWTGSQRLFVEGLGTLAEDCLAAYSVEQFSPRRAVRSLCELVERAMEFAAGQSRLRAAASGRGGLAAQVQAAKLLAQLAAPIMPGFAQRLWTTLGCAGAPVWDDLAPVPPGQVIGPDRVFFTSLPSDLAARLGSADPAAQPESVDPAAQGES